MNTGGVDDDDVDGGDDDGGGEVAEPSAIERERERSGAGFSQVYCYYLDAEICGAKLFAT